MAAWLSGFNNRIKLTADNTKVDSDLTQFPLTVFLKSGNGDTTKVFDEVGVNKYKIAITQSDGTTQLYVEIEEWDSTNKVGVLHAGLSGDTLSSSADTDYYLYFDNTAADNTSYVGDTGSRTEVWDSNFMAVYHMNQDPSGTAPQMIDSTANNNDGSSNGTMTSTDLVDGQTGKAIDFDGTDDYISIPNTASLNVEGGDFTIEVLVNSDQNSADQAFFDKRGTNDGYGFMWSAANGFDLVKYGVIDQNVSYSLSTATWLHFAAVQTFETQAEYFANGVSQGTFSDTSDYVSNTAQVEIGARGDNSGGYQDYFDGRIDEVRLSNVARSAAWIKASYYSLFDSLLTYGAEEKMVIGADSGIGTEIVARGKFATITDSGIGLENVLKGKRISIADSGIGAEVAERGKLILITETGSGVDAVQVDKNLFISEVGIGADTILRNKNIIIVDSGAGVEVIQYGKAVIVLDIGSGTELAIMGKNLKITDLGSGLDAITGWFGWTKRTLPTDTWTKRTPPTDTWTPERQ